VSNTSHFKIGSMMMIVATLLAMPFSTVYSGDQSMQALINEARSFSLLASRLNGPPALKRTASPNTRTRPKAKPPYNDIIQSVAKSYGISPDLIAAVIKCESNWKPDALSPKGARGLMQVMPRTAKGEFQVDPDQLWLPNVNIHVGTAYLRVLANRYDGNPSATIAAYNAGPKRFASGATIPLETKKYAKCIRRWYRNYRMQYK